jgi:DNA invertase Pin-like site-specific DNA recombinase
VARGAMRVAIYARVSTGEQNPELQLRELRDYAKRRGFIIHREYVETVPGDVRRRKRAPEFEAMMADARRRRFDCVLVWKYDRFARSLGALVAALQEFRDLGIDFISHTQAIDTTTPMGRLFFHVIGSFAEFERDVIVERVRAGLANARAKGKRLGRPIQDPAAEQRVLALKRDEGLSLRQIAAREGLSPSGVRKMLLRAEAAASPAA